MIRVHQSLARLLEAIKNKLCREVAPPDLPPSGCTHRTTRLPNGCLVSVEVSVADPDTSGYELSEHQRIKRETAGPKDRGHKAEIDRCARRPHAMADEEPKSLEAGVPDPCPLLVDFLARRARR